MANEKKYLGLDALKELVKQIKEADTAVLTSVSNGTTVAGKATADADGNVITTTYATKAEVSDVSTMKTQLETLIGDDASKSARSIANEELAKQLIPETAAESLDTLQEIAAWIQAHPGDASEMNGKITTLEGDVTTLKGDASTAGSVAKSVKDAVDALDADVTSDDTTLVSVQVVETDGKITDVVVSDLISETTSVEVAALFAAEE